MLLHPCAPPSLTPPLCSSPPAAIRVSGFSSGFRESPLGSTPCGASPQNAFPGIHRKTLTSLQSPILICAHFAQILSQLDKSHIFFPFCGFSHDKISSIRPSTNAARGRLISGVSIKPRLIHKLVKPREVVRSRSTDKIRIDKLLITEAQPEIGAAHTAALRVSDAAVRWKLGCFNLSDSVGATSRPYSWRCSSEKKLFKY